MAGRIRIIRRDNVVRFLGQFTQWLKANGDVYDKAGAKSTRKRLRRVAKEFLDTLLEERKGGRCPADEALPALARYREQRPEVAHELAALEDYLRELSEHSSKTPERSAAQEPPVIGRICLTSDTPATPTEFHFWMEHRPSAAAEVQHIEPGRLVTAVDQSGTKLIGIVENVQAVCDVRSPVDAFYSHAYGDPHVELPTRRPTVRIVTAEAVWRTDGRFEPPLGDWSVRFATAEEIAEAYGADIPETYRVLAGFACDHAGRPVPIHLDSRYLMGYEGAHVNISGASGLAAKTSYALFLLLAVLAYSRRAGSNARAAAIAFNVKEADLMRIDRLPHRWSEAWRWLAEWDAQPDGRNSQLWRAALEHGVDPLEVIKSANFFAPKHPHAENGAYTQREGPYEVFSYGLTDIVQAGAPALLMLFDRHDVDEKMEAAVHALVDDLTASSEEAALKTAGGNRPKQFKTLFEALQRLMKQPKDTRRSREWITLGGTQVHIATLNKLFGRLRHAVYHQLPGLLLPDDGRGHPLPIQQTTFRAGDFWVVDISKLHEKGQRMVFWTVLSRVHALLERVRNEGSQDPHVPNRVVIFVDELNKFAPAGREAGPLKAPIIDIAARGRSVGLSLIGAEQLASQIDEEVLVNTSTFVVGRSHALELGQRAYEWLRKGFREKAAALRKGDIFVWHAMHTRPILLSFPIPLHALREE